MMAVETAYQRAKRIIAARPRPSRVVTHEDYITRIRAIVAARLDGEERARVMGTKLVYGTGQAGGVRGTTFYGKWEAGHNTIDIAEVCAFGEENLVQIAGTTIHELAHVIAGLGSGHGKTWKEQAARLGLRKAMAAGQRYMPAYFDPAFRFAWASLPFPTDGKPINHLETLSGLIGILAKPCTIGIGTRGGKSRGPGSGSRLRKYTCDCGVIVRAATDKLQAHCDKCSTTFKQAA